jgi:ATP-dependent Clp protease protease subunit
MRKILEVDRRIKAKPADLLDEPVVIRVRDFNEDAADKFAQEMQKAHNTGQPIIPVVIDSFGGYVHSLLAMIGEIRSAALPVATIAMGKAMSCGAMLLGMGTPGHRYADPHSSVMIHDVSSWEVGKVEELKAGVKETERLHKTIFHMLAENCGHKDQDYFLKLIHDRSHAEIFLTAKQAKRHKIVDQIHVPSFKTTVSVDISFG